MGGIKLFMSKLTNDKVNLRNKELDVFKSKKDSVVKELEDNIDSYVSNKSYSKIDHIVGIRTLDILVRDICNANPYKALDLYLRVVNPKYTRYSGFLSTLCKDSDTYTKSYRSKYCNNELVFNSGNEIPYMEVVLRRELVTQLRAMKKYINDNMVNIVRNSKNASRKELVEVCRSRMSTEMVGFCQKLNIEDYEERKYSSDKYYDPYNRVMDITDTLFMSDMSNEINVTGQYKVKIAQKAQVALLYKAINDGKDIDRIKYTLEYEEYEIQVRYIKGLDGNTYDIVEQLLRERLPKDILEQIDILKGEVVDKLNKNLGYYRKLHNTELISYLIINILDSLK